MHSHRRPFLFLGPTIIDSAIGTPLSRLDQRHASNQSYFARDFTSPMLLRRHEWKETLTPPPLKTAKTHPMRPPTRQQKGVFVKFTASKKTEMVEKPGQYAYTSHEPKIHNRRPGDPAKTNPQGFQEKPENLQASEIDDSISDYSNATTYRLPYYGTRQRSCDARRCKSAGQSRPG